MMDDDFDDLLRDASQSYNVPPAPPREAMWEAIARARDASTVIPIAAPRRMTRWLATAAGIAAVLMVGVVIGRSTREPALAPSMDVATRPSAGTATPLVAETDTATGTEGSNDVPRAASGLQRVAAGQRTPARSFSPGRERSREGDGY